MKTVFNYYVLTYRSGFHKKESTISSCYSYVANKVRSIQHANESLFHWSRENISIPKSHKSWHTILNNLLEGNLGETSYT